MACRSRGWTRTGWTCNAAALAIMLLVLVPGLPARSSSSAGHETAVPGQVLIVVGLAGDTEHEKLFRETATTLRDWLTGPLRFSRDSVRILFGAGGEAEPGHEPATCANCPPRRGRNSWKTGSRGSLLGPVSGSCRLARRACQIPSSRAGSGR